MTRVLRMIANILTANYKCFLLNRDNLREPIHTQLSQKQNKNSQFFSVILKSRLNFEHFPKEDHPHSRCIFEILDSDKRG